MTWRDRAACADADPTIFDLEHTSLRAMARSYCERCPVAGECAAYGIEYRHEGVWGGLVLHDGKVLRERRPTTCATCGRFIPQPSTGRPRKFCDPCRRRVAA